MNKGKILFFDDDKDITGQFAGLMSDSGFEIITFNQISELRKAITDDDTMYQTKALVFDLANNETESSGTKGFEILKDIYHNFNRFRIPIFIHSAFSEQIEDFQNCGTVWKVEKSGKSLSDIVEIIEKLDQSGFIEVFTPNGIIEGSLMRELHKSFTEQFRKGEIEKIIDSISNQDVKEYKLRLEKIFKRIAIKSLMSELISPVISDGETVNPIEHYYRRISTVDVWTGDIFLKNDKNEMLIILTPRCNVASKSIENLLICLIEGDFPGDNKKDKIKRALTDNPDFSGHAFRFLPPCPLFIGGKVNLSSHKTISKELLLTNYTRIITLSDDLTNEILGKFGSYFLRTGINTINQSELTSYLDSLTEPQK